MKKALLAATVLLAFGSGSLRAWAGDGGAGRTYAPGEFGTLLAGKGKPAVTAIAGSPDRMYGVMGEEDPPVNLSAHWVYRAPKTAIVVDPATGNSPKELRVRFDPNDRVEGVTFDFGP